MDNSQLLENLLLTGTPQEAAAFFKSNQKDVNAGRALAIACRFCGLEYVKALVESGAAFEKSDDYENPYYWLAPLKFYEKQREVYCAYEGDDCFENKIERKRADDNSVETFYILPEEQRAEIAKYLCENSGRVNFEPGELLFFSITSNNKKITAVLKETGVTFTAERILSFTEQPRYVMWYTFIAMLEALDDDVFADIVRDVVKEAGGKRIKIWTKHCCLGYSMYERKDRFFNLVIFRTFIENFKLSKIDKENLLKEAIDQDSTECLAICAERGWLRQFCKLDEMIAYASGIKNTECSAWLLDYRNRNFDLAAERAKTEKKAQRELNAAPYSITALKNIWNWKKQEDGTLVITGYNGTDSIIKVPSRIGRRAVTAVGCKTFKTSDNYFTKVSEVILPDSIRSISECVFSFLRSLEEVVVPDSVVEIGEEAFCGCRKLTEINILSSVKKTADSAGTPRSVKLPTRIKRIGKGAFRGCSSLEKITIPDGTVEIGEEAFINCHRLKTVVIPASIRIMGKEIFSGCDIVTVIVEPNSYAEEYCRKNNVSFGYADRAEV